MRNLFRKLISVLLIVACVFINTSAFAESNLTIHFLDVGQGAAAIIQCDGEVMMFDGGSAGNSSFIYSYLQNTLGIEHIDVMVASHPHEDHIGGLSGALNACSVGTIYSPVTEYDSKTFSSLLKYAGKQGLSLTVPAVGDTFTVGSALQHSFRLQRHMTIQTTCRWLCASYTATHRSCSPAMLNGTQNMTWWMQGWSFPLLF